jgi:hypothetical protein
LTKQQSVAWLPFRPPKKLAFKAKGFFIKLRSDFNVRNGENNVINAVN